MSRRNSPLPTEERHAQSARAVKLGGLLPAVRERAYSPLSLSARALGLIVEQLICFPLGEMSLRFS